MGVRATQCPLDHVNRQFRAPNPNTLWISRFTSVATYSSFAIVAFVIDAFTRRIVGWRAIGTAHVAFVLDGPDKALHVRRPCETGSLVHHRDRGVHFVSIRYPERLAAAGILPSVCSVGVSYENAFAETVNGLHKAEVIYRRRPCRSFEADEYSTLESDNWPSKRPLLEPIGNAP